MKTLLKKIAITGAVASLCTSVWAQTDSLQAAPTSTTTNTVAQATKQAQPCPFKNVQFSLFPYVGTYQPCSDSTQKVVSVNLTVGYVNAVNGVEIGCIMDIVRDSVQGVQLAGVGNMVGGKVNGVQVGGVFNLAQACQGIQVAGTLNGTKTMNGVQVAGVANVSDTCSGVQVAGTVNANRQADGAQVAGVANVSASSTGLMLAGVVNVAKQSDGAAVAGVLNTSVGHRGLQVAGVLNVADSIKGSQIGLVNVADSISGYQIGLINYARKGGYHCWELSADEIFYTNLAFRSGVKRFHAQLMAGIRPEKFDNPLWTLGWGVGTTFGGDKRVNYDIDIQFQQVMRGDEFQDAQLIKLYAGTDIRLAKSLSLAAGVSYNMFRTDERDLPFDLPTPYSPITDNHVGNHHNLQSWVGGKIALRFF